MFYYFHYSIITTPTSTRDKLADCASTKFTGRTGERNKESNRTAILHDKQRSTEEEGVHLGVPVPNFLVHLIF